MMEFLGMVWDSVYALSVGIIAGVLMQRVGMIDWMLDKIMRK